MVHCDSGVERSSKGAMGGGGESMNELVGSARVNVPLLLPFHMNDGLLHLRDIIFV